MEENVKKKTFKDTLGVITGQPWFSGLVPLFIIMTVASIVSPAFLTQDNLIDMARTASYSFCVAAPFTFLMTTGGIDLSMGAMTSLGGVVCGKALLTGMGIVPALLCAVLVGCLVGIVKSLLIVDLGLPGFIATLGLQYIINGAILVWTEGINVTGLPLEFKALGQGSLIPGTRFYNTIAIAIVIAIVFWFLLEKTKFGRCVCAVGGNQETARIAGIRTRVYIYTCHMMVSAFAGIAGSLYASRFSSAITTMGTGTEMNIISAVVIGGTSMGGGFGTLIGTVFGSYLFACITNALVLMHVSVYWQNLVYGVILIIAIIIDKYRRAATAGANA